MFNLSRPAFAQLNMPLTVSTSGSDRRGENLAVAELHRNADCTIRRAPGLLRYLLCRHTPAGVRADERPGLLSQIRSFSTVSAINWTLTSMHFIAPPAASDCTKVSTCSRTSQPRFWADYGNCNDRTGGQF